jgi:hypothetical protein
MFTWICPQCGREVPPSYSECPTCAEAKKGAPAPVGAATGVPPSAPPGYGPPPGYAPQPPQPPPQYVQQPPYAAPTYGVPQYPAEAAPYSQQGRPYAPPPPQQPPPFAPPPPYQAPPQAQPAQVHTIPDPYATKSGMPGWLTTLLFAAVLVGIGALLYLYVLPHSSSAATSAAPAEDKGAKAASSSPYAKFLEVAGLRFTEERNKAKLQLLVINHSSGELSGLQMTLSISTTASKPGDPPLTTADIKVPSLGPWESKEVTVPVETKARAYELPDWQFLKATFDITAK